MLQQHWTFAEGQKATATVFSPTTDQVVTIHKYGEIRLYANIDAAEDDFKTVLNIQAKVYSADDHGLTGFAFDPLFGQNGFGEPQFVRQVLTYVIVLS